MFTVEIRGQDMKASPVVVVYEIKCVVVTVTGCVMVLADCADVKVTVSGVVNVCVVIDGDVGVDNREELVEGVKLLAEATEPKLVLVEVEPGMALYIAKSSTHSWYGEYVSLGS
jgi:hypothetical protein